MTTRRNNFLLKRVYLIVSLLLLIIAWPYEGFTGNLKGRVTDKQNGNAIPYTVIYLSGGSFVRTFQSDAKGYYSFDKIPAGNYILIARCIGYKIDTLQISFKKGTDEINQKIMLVPEIHQLSEVSIVSKADKETRASALNDEKKAINVINILSAKTIETLPDRNVADVMPRISGISMTKNSFGSNSQVIIRGMPPRYNSVLMNGVFMPSTSSSGRSVSLDMFSADLVGRVEVIKSGTPDLEADAIGGTVNIIMKEAPDAQFLKVQLGTGYNQYYFDHKFLTFDHSKVAKKDFSELYGPDYLADASEFSRNNLVATSTTAFPDYDINISGGRRFFAKKFGIMAALNTQSNSLANTYDYTSYVADTKTNNPAPEYFEHQVYSKNQKQYGVYIKLDYQINPYNKLSIYSSFFQSNEHRVREYSDHQTENGGTFIRPIETQTETDISDISVTTLRGDHKLLKNFTIDWTLLYAIANSRSPDFASITEAQGGNDPIFLNYTKPVVRDWQWDIDQNMSAYLNVNYNVLLFQHLFDFKVGGLYREKFRKNYANEYYFDSPDYQNYPNPDLLTVPLTNDKNDQQKKGDAYLNPGNYRAWENIGAAYGMLNTEVGKLLIVCGLRFETTYMSSEHNQNNLQVPVAKATQQYFDFFPSLHLTYRFTENQNLRFSIYRAINRPNYTEIIPYADPRAGSQSGNPDLQPAYGTCVDLRYEIYPHEEDVFTAGLFYKNINHAIENVVAAGSENTSFQNVDKCINYGLEIVAMKKLGNFHISANYTYTHSEVSDRWHDFVYKNGIYDTVISVNGTRPLIGQSPHLFNLSLSYHNKKAGFQASISYTFQSYYLIFKNDHYNFDTYQKNYNNLGLTIQQKIGTKFILTLKVSNFLNSPITYYMKNMDNTLIEKSYNYQTYFIGLKFSM